MAPQPRRNSRPSRSSSRGKRVSTQKNPAFPGRVVKVWVALVGALTVVGGGLLMVDGRSVPRVDGMSLSPLAAAAFEGRRSDPVYQTRQAIEAGRWQAIVIHHSGNVIGSPASIEREHEARNLRGLGHHFIIGNGQGMEDGQLHIGYRWLDQLPGAHAAGDNGDWYNRNAISICLVGDGNRRPFTQAQLDRLDTLLDSLCRELNIPRDRVYLHSQIAPVSDPGKLFPADRILTAGPDQQPGAPVAGRPNAAPQPTKTASAERGTP